MSSWFRFGCFELQEGRKEHSLQIGHAHQTHTCSAGVFFATLQWEKPSLLKFIWVQLSLEGYIITYLLAEADLALRFYPRPIDLVRMFTPEVTGRASICIRPWARFFPTLIGLSMSAPCLLTLITLLFFFSFLDSVLHSCRRMQERPIDSQNEERKNRARVLASGE